MAKKAKFRFGRILLPPDPLLPLTLKDIREAVEQYVSCDPDGVTRKDFYGMAVMLNARTKAELMEYSAREIGSRPRARRRKR